MLDPARNLFNIMKYITQKVFLIIDSIKNIKRKNVDRTVRNKHERFSVIKTPDCS